MSGDLIRVENLTVGFGGKPLMKDVGFAVAAGEVFVILGGSGCGKSTLLKNMIGLYRPMAGRIFIAGEDIVQATGDGKWAIQRKFGVAYQAGALF